MKGITITALVLLVIIAGAATATNTWAGRLCTADRSFWDTDTAVSMSGWTGRLGTGDFSFWRQDCLVPVADQHEMIGANGSGGVHIPNSTN